MNDESIKNENIKNDKEVNINNEINDEILNIDDNFKIALNGIKDSEQNKYIEQINNMVDDIFKNTDKEIYSSINSIIKNSYEIFVNNKNKKNNNNEIIIDNFYTKLSLFISNSCLRKFPQGNINVLLRYLLLIAMEIFPNI